MAGRKIPQAAAPRRTMHNQFRWMTTGQNLNVCVLSPLSCLDYIDLTACEVDASNMDGGTLPFQNADMPDNGFPVQASGQIALMPVEA